MKVVIVKEQGTDSLVPITLSEEDTVEILRQQWSVVTGRDSLDYFFKCCDAFIEDCQLVGELPSLASSSSCVEVIAERSIQLELRPFGLIGRNLELKVPLTLEVGLLTAALCNALEVSPRPVTFYRSADPALKEKTLGPILSPKLSLGEQGVSENERLEAVVHVDIRVDSRQLVCAGHAEVASLFDPNLPAESQRLCYGDRVLPATDSLLTALPEALFSPDPIQLDTDWAATLRFHVGDSDAFQEARGWSRQSLWDAFAACSEIACGSRSQLSLWLAEEEVDSTTAVRDLPGAAPGATLLVTVDRPCPVRVLLTSGREVAFRLRRGARLSQLMALVAMDEVDEEDAAFRLASVGGPALPPEASLRQCDVRPDTLLRVLRDQLEVLFELERRTPVPDAVPLRSGFPLLLARAAKVLGVPADTPGLLELRCGCGSRIKAGDPKCAVLPPSCCRAVPRRLRLVRYVTVRVLRMFHPDLVLLSERFDSIATVREVRGALLRKAKSPVAQLEWRLCRQGRLLADAKALCEMQTDSGDVELEMEEQMALCVTSGATRVVWLTWPNSTTDSLMAELRTAGVIPKGRYAMLLHGKTLVLRREDRWVTLWSNGLKSGDEVKIVQEEAVPSAQKENDGADKKEAVQFTSLKIICRNWGAPDFEATLPTPVTVLDVRQLVASRFHIHSSQVFLMQHRAKLTDSGAVLIDIGNYRWSDTSGAIYQADDCVAYKYSLEKDSETIPIPGPHRWKLFVRYINN